MHSRAFLIVPAQGVSKVVCEGVVYWDSRLVEMKQWTFGVFVCTPLKECLSASMKGCLTSAPRESLCKQVKLSCGSEDTGGQSMGCGAEEITEAPSLEHEGADCPLLLASSQELVGLVAH